MLPQRDLSDAGFSTCSPSSARLIEITADFSSRGASFSGAILSRLPWCSTPGWQPSLRWVYMSSSTKYCWREATQCRYSADCTGLSRQRNYICKMPVNARLEPASRRHNRRRCQLLAGIHCRWIRDTIASWYIFSIRIAWFFSRAWPLKQASRPPQHISYQYICSRQRRRSPPQRWLPRCFQHFTIADTLTWRHANFSRSLWCSTKTGDGYFFARFSFGFSMTIITSSFWLHLVLRLRLVP